MPCSLENYREAIKEMTAGDRRVFIRLDGRDVMLEAAGEGEDRRYVLTWGLEGERSRSGNEGLVAILDTMLAVERVMNFPPPTDKDRKFIKVEDSGIYDDSKRAARLRDAVKLLVKEIVEANEKKRAALYRRRS